MVKCSFSKEASCRLTVCFSNLFLSTMQLYLLFACKNTRGHKQREQFADVLQDWGSYNFAKFKIQK